MTQILIQIFSYLLMIGFVLLVGYFAYVLITMPFSSWWEKPTTENGRRSIY
jgi:hypothetical protein